MDISKILRRFGGEGYTIHIGFSEKETKKVVQTLESAFGVKIEMSHVDT